MRLAICLLILLLAGGAAVHRYAFQRIPPSKAAEVQIQTTKPDAPVKVSVCQLKSDAAEGGFGQAVENA
jgi:hypothetical protein